MSSPYLDALKLLARRELSEFQVRQRLSRKGHPMDDIDAAVARLKSERAIDDMRVAEAIARTSMTVKRRGRLRGRTVPAPASHQAVSAVRSARALGRALATCDTV